MSLLQRKNWPIILLLGIVTNSIFIFLVAYMLDLYDKKAWYMKWQYWVIAGLCLFFPVLLLAVVLEVHMLCKIASKLKIPGSEIYNTPYTWILCIIVPVIGWVMLIVMYIYLNVWIIIKLCQGEGEKYIK